MRYQVQKQDHQRCFWKAASWSHLAHSVAGSLDSVAKKAG